MHLVNSILCISSVIVHTDVPGNFKGVFSSGGGRSCFFAVNESSLSGRTLNRNRNNEKDSIELNLGSSARLPFLVRRVCNRSCSSCAAAGGASRI